MLQPKIIKIRNAARRDEVLIDNDFKPHFWNDMNEQVEFWTFETDRFEVSMYAETEHDLDLSWLHTKYEIHGDKLFIRSSCRYSQGDVRKHGSEQVLEWIHEDHEQLRDIAESYMGMHNKYRVFVARCVVRHKKSDAELGTDVLGQCIYDSFEDFRTSSTFYEMVSLAIGEARDAIEDLNM